MTIFLYGLLHFFEGFFSFRHGEEHFKSRREQRKKDIVSIRSRNFLTISSISVMELISLSEIERIFLSSYQQLEGVRHLSNKMIENRGRPSPVCVRGWNQIRTGIHQRRIWPASSGYINSSGGRGDLKALCECVCVYIYPYNALNNL